jgi:hypothetical protein
MIMIQSVSVARIAGLPVSVAARRVHVVFAMAGARVKPFQPKFSPLTARHVAQD